MDHYEKYTETKTVTRRKFIKTTCDKCNAEIPSGDSYDTRDFELSFTVGTCYPENSGDQKGWKVEDLCNSCLEWLKNVLIGNNVKLKEIDRDW